MTKLTRRQLLLGGLLAGVAATGLHEFLRLRSRSAQQAKLTDLALRSPQYIEKALNKALTGDIAAVEAVQKIQSSVSLRSPTVAYERDLSKILIQCSRLGTEQYLTGKFIPDYDGSIAELPTYSDRLAAFTQFASIQGPDQVEVKSDLEVPDSTTSDSTLLQYSDPLQDDIENIRSIIEQLAGQVVTLKWISSVYWGFVLVSDRSNILIYRGTQRRNEWLRTIYARQVESSQEPDFKFVGSVHQGFARIYGELAPPTLTVLKQLNPAVPLYIAGHSLGAAIATLAAMDIALQLPEFKQQIRLYCYAGPRVGDPTFAEAHSQLIPNSYRVANWADPTPLVPPNHARGITYVHVGEPWGFVSEKGDIGSHHYISTYRTAIEQEVETNQPQDHSISGVK